MLCKDMKRINVVLGLQILVVKILIKCSSLTASDCMLASIRFIFYQVRNGNTRTQL